DAVGALFHDAAAAHGHVRVSTELQARRVPVLVQQKVETAHFVRAVVRAVPRADAAVVDHVVQTFVAVNGGAHGADDLARRVLALHARNGLEIGLRIRDRTTVIGVDPDPMHLTSAQHLVLADDRDVVLGLTADDAGVATDAGIDVD